MTAVSAGSLPRSSPSEQSVDAAGILAFLDAVAAAAMDLHSVMILRHGHVVAEGWWAPYRADRVHMLYSLSKSFTSTAVGIAASEGLLSLDDPVVKFFPDKVPAESSPYLHETTVRHLLSMASGHAEDTAGRLTGPDRVRSFLSIPADREPGTLFCYNQGCTHTLSAIITKLTGQRLLDYLRPRLFQPLGIEQAHWIQTDEGIDQGYSGLHVTTESVAKLGELYLRNGRWDGRQIVPQAYVAQATSKQIGNAGQGDNPDWQQGYGFQFWMSRNGAYRGDGAFGQFCVVIPHADAVVVCTANVSDMQAELDLIWRHLLPALTADAAADKTAEGQLAQRLRALSTAVIDARANPPDHEITFTRVGDAPPNLDGLTEIRVDGNRLTLHLDGAEHSLDLRPGRWVEGDLPGVGSGLPPVAAIGGWTTPDEFQADIVLVTTPHRLQLRARAGDNPTFRAGPT